jgi:hypothetical protein
VVQLIVILSEPLLRSEEPALRERERPNGIWANRAQNRPFGSPPYQAAPLPPRRIYFRRLDFVAMTFPFSARFQIADPVPLPCKDFSTFSRHMKFFPSP